MATVKLIIFIMAASGAAALFMVTIIGIRLSAQSAETRELKKVKRRQVFQKSGAELPVWFERWADQVETRIRRGHTKFKFVHYMALMLILMALAVAVGLVLLKNTVAFGILVATAIVIPEHIVRNQIHGRRNKLLLQLGPAIRLLASEHAGTAQVNRAIVRVAPKLDEPLKGVFDRAARGFLSGKKEDQVFGEMLPELDFEYGRIFVQALRVVANNANMRHLLWWLAEQIASQVDDILEEQSSITGERLMSIAAVALIFPVLFFMLRAVPETYPFLTENPVGRMVVCICLGAPLANVLFDRLLNAR